MLKKLFLRLIFTGILVFILAGCSQKEAGIKFEKYVWKNVRIVGGGFVDGFVYHPTEKGLVYARTDMGGAYRRDSIDSDWVPIMDWVSYEDVNLMGIESIALDPHNPDKLYLACGMYSNEYAPYAEILRSDDRGNSFQRSKLPIKMGGNENGRGNGERLTVDPNNGKILYFGSRHDGLWKSTDGAVTWNRVTTFPDVTEVVPDSLKNERSRRYWQFAQSGSGVVTVLCDPGSGKPGEGSKDVYALVSLMNRDNFFCSRDGGDTWKAVPHQPAMYRPNHGVMSGDGCILISYGDNPGPWRMKNGGVWKYTMQTGMWTDITPEKPDPYSPTDAMGYASVATDPNDPNTILACTFYRSWEKGGEEIFRSVDGGKTYKGVFASGGKFDYSKAPYVSHTGIHWLFDCEIDPHNPDHALFTTGYGGHECFNLTDMDKDEPVVWSVVSSGIEETVPLQLLSPPQGAPLITGIGDYGGFVHWNLDEPALEGNFVNPHFGNTDDVACAWLKPEIVVRVGVESDRVSNNHNIGYSLDMGKTWKPTSSMPSEKSSHGHIAVSADGSCWIWTPQNSMPYFTCDNGAHWEKITDLPENTRVVADKVSSNSFYGVNIAKGIYYSSTDAGRHFKAIRTGMPALSREQLRGRGDSRGGQDRIYAVPGKENELWIAAWDGLYFKPTEDTLFIRIPLVTEIHGFGFGKGVKKKSYPAIYLIGIIDGHHGIFRSDDATQTWTKINDDAHQWGLLLHITGDPKKYGRVYVGTHGRGAVYGDPAK